MIMNWSMGGLMKNKIFFWILSIVFLVPMLIFLLSIYQTYIGGGYKYIQGRQDDWHIEKNGKRIIGGAVLDLQVGSGFAFGLRLPADYLRCGSSNKIRLLNQESYFILNTDNGKISNFNSREIFENELNSLGLFSDLRLDYSLFDRTWSKYSGYYKRMDFNSCTEDESFTIGSP